MMKSLNLALCLSLAFAGAGARADEALPSDLQSVKSKLESLILPESEQLDMTWKTQLVTVRGERYEASAQLVSREAASFGPSEHGMIRRFEFLDLSETPASRRWAKVERELFGKPGEPYFCSTIRELASAQGRRYAEARRAKICRDTVASVLKSRLSVEGTNEYSVAVEGDFYGTYRYYVIYLRSLVEETKFLRIEFDLQHEI